MKDLFDRILAVRGSITLGDELRLEAALAAVFALVDPASPLPEPVQGPSTQSAGSTRPGSCSYPRTDQNFPSQPYGSDQFPSALGFSQDFQFGQSGLNTPGQVQLSQMTAGELERYEQALFTRMTGRPPKAAA